MDNAGIGTLVSPEFMRRDQRTVTIGSGHLRGRVLRYPEVASLRPSMQRTKASLLSSLADELQGAVFADLYAGAGAVGIEAISRGAQFVHFVERERAALDALRDNVRVCDIVDRSRVHADTVARVLDARPCPLAAATIAFADPPYEADIDDELLRRIDVAALPALHWLVVEHRTRVVPATPDGMQSERARRFGDTTLTYFVRT